nr:MULTISPECIES: hypothetical protein [Paenibacillus]
MGFSRVSLSMWSGINFTNRRIVFRRKGIAVRDLRVFRFDNVLSSFRIRNEVVRSQVTLILFSRINFQGSFRVFRGSQSVADLRRFSFNNVTSSFILVDRILSDFEIALIQSTGRPPHGVIVIKQ